MGNRKPVEKEIAYANRRWQGWGALAMIPLWFAIVIGQVVTGQEFGWEQQVLSIAAMLLVVEFAGLYGRCLVRLEQIRQAPLRVEEGPASPRS
jgi:hypothetical protein